MKRALLLCIGLLHCAEPIAGPLDGGMEAGVCPGPLSRGACTGELLQRCDESHLLEVNCATIGTNRAGRCVLVNDSYGYACGVAANAQCRFAVQHGDHQHISYAFCEGENNGCVLGPTGGFCASVGGTCDGSSIARCRGALLVSDCRGGQVLATDCAAFGGQCDPALGACVGIPEGGSCDRGARRCAEGLECQYVRRLGAGTCIRSSN